MTNEEAIKILLNTPIDIRSTREDDIHTLYATAQNMAIDALRQTAWIPVGERLPDIDQSVLICTKDGQITDGYRWNSEDWFLAWGEFNGEHIGGEYGQIIAWTPLPEPYRGGDDNGKD